MVYGNQGVTKGHFFVFLRGFGCCFLPVGSVADFLPQGCRNGSSRTRKSIFSGTGKTAVDYEQRKKYRAKIWKYGLFFLNLHSTIIFKPILE